MFATTDVNYNLYIQDTTGITVSTTISSRDSIVRVINNTHFNNIGYVTENSGAAACRRWRHDCPWLCKHPPRSLHRICAGEMVTVTSIDATNITVAIKKPDGSAGTTQTVYWRAEV